MACENSGDEEVMYTQQRTCDDRCQQTPQSDTSTKEAASKASLEQLLAAPEELERWCVGDVVDAHWRDAQGKLGGQVADAFLA